MERNLFAFLNGFLLKIISHGLSMPLFMFNALLFFRLKGICESSLFFKFDYKRLRVNFSLADIGFSLSEECSFKAEDLHHSIFIEIDSGKFSEKTYLLAQFILQY